MSSRESSLLQYCKNGNYDAVRKLLNKGANIHAKDIFGWTGLHQACRHSNNVKLVWLLLDRGADVNAKTNNGFTALHQVCRYNNNIELARLLLDSGADIHAKTSYGFTALAMVSKRNKEIENLLNHHHPEAKIDPFYEIMLEEDDDNILMKIKELIPEIQNVIHAKTFYTYLSISQKISGIITVEERKKYTNQMLQRTTETTINSESYAIYKIILKKSLKDKLINDMTYEKLASDAQETRTKNCDYVKRIHGRLDNLEEQVQVLKNRVDSIENKVSCICDSVNTIKNAFQKQLRLKAVTGCMGAILNVISMGVAGAALDGVANSVMSSIVDFSDIEHIKEVVNQEGCSEAMTAVQDAEAVLENIEEYGQHKFDQILLEEMNKAGSNQSSIVYATIVAKAISHEAKIVAEAVPVKSTMTINFMLFVALVGILLGVIAIVAHSEEQEQPLEENVMDDGALPPLDNGEDGICCHAPFFNMKTQIIA